MGQHRVAAAVAHQHEAARDADHRLHRPQQLSVDERPGKDLGGGLVDPPGKQQAIAPDGEHPFAGFVEIEVATPIVLWAVEAIEHAALERETDRLDAPLPERRGSTWGVACPRAAAAGGQ